MLNFIRSGNGVAVMLNGVAKAVSFDNPVFEELLIALRKSDENAVEELLDRAKVLREHPSGLFDVDEDGVVHIDGRSVPPTLSMHLLKFIDAKCDVMPLLNFWYRLRENPSAESRKDLYDFLTVNNVPITEDGLFLGYRRVTDDFKDFHTGDYDNSVGCYVSMDRDAVDADRNNTCSRGLHIAAYNYAANDYHSGQGRMVEVLVDPADVVAVPPDYDQQKMRVCAYTVIRECTEERKTLLVEEEKGLNYRTYYLVGYKKPCMSMTMENVTSHKPSKSGTYATVRAADREQALEKFLGLA